VTARRLNALGRQRSLAIERLSHSERELRGTLERLVQVRDRERRRLAMDLHDDVLPALMAVSMRLELARDHVEDENVRGHLCESERELRSITRRLRHVTFDLIPDGLARDGLATTLRHRLEHMRDLTGIRHELRDHLSAPPSPQAAAILYRIALEALRNVARHAQARHVYVRLDQVDNRVEAMIADDGVGFDLSHDTPGHFGLELMEQHAALAGGGVDIRSRPTRGTTVTFWVPADFRAPENHSSSPARIARVTAPARSDAPSLS
jgi:signal transduction histidine kinase